MDWVKPERIHAALPSVAMAVHYSRNHMRIKKGKTARQKFHILLPIRLITDSKAHADLKKRLADALPYVDLNALDAARFFYGTDDPRVEFYPGGRTINDILEEEDFNSGMGQGHYGDQSIPEGRRNATMSRKDREAVWL
ncbi:MAG: hypothetical protein IJ708_07390 [Clostridia bacterium]|nr:hypothetical protein [Clostridia bacterium]